MNKAQYEKACAVVDGDATGVGRLFDSATGDYCALGGLLHAAGVSDAELARNVPYGRFLDRLRETYGIRDDGEMVAIWRCNDRHFNVISRRAALKALFASWVEE